MPNNLVFNNNPENLKTYIYGSDGSTLRPIAVDNNGEFLFSTLSVISVTATNLDIRDLNAATDSVFVTANNLDIRDLNGSQDSVQISGNFFVEDTSTTVVTSGTTYHLLTKNISPYSENSFFIRNLGASSITLTLQVAPVDDDNFYVSSTPTAVTSGNNSIATATVVSKFARLQVTTGGTATVVAYYNARA